MVRQLRRSKQKRRSISVESLESRQLLAADATIFFEDFESLPLENSLLVPPFDDYVAVFTGTLDVTEAGDYTFGINSDDGQLLAIDLEQDGIDIIDDEVIFDDTTHGRQDRYSTCGDVDQSCEGLGDDPFTLEVGQYEFMYLYFERGGGSGGEFFYGKGLQETWNADEFALVGDPSKGIGVVDGVTVTIYKETEGNAIGNLSAAEGAIFEDDLIIGTEKLEFADVAENPGGRFSVDNVIPGAAEWALANDPNPEDFTAEGPEGWTRDNSKLLEGGSAEYNGWTWLNKEFWVAQQGDQNRTNFELGEGTMLVADPDAHDDFIDNGGHQGAACLAVQEIGPECGLFTASVSTPQINLRNVEENTAVLEFASSWWDEDTQSAEGRVEFFAADGSSIEERVLLRWESISDSENFKPVAGPDGDGNTRNELITIDLENPAEAAYMVVTFDMPYASNDWWWAVDNVKVTATTVDVVADPASVGDLDGDGEVGFGDFLILSSNFGQDVQGGAADGDLDEDGSVQFADFLALSNNFGKSVDEIFAELG